MTFTQKRNKLIAALYAAVGCPVVLASQVQPEAEPPFIVYTVTTDYIPDGSLGHYLQGDGEAEGSLVSVRVEQPTATFSFTACSIDRITENGTIFGADEALDLAHKAQGFFLHTGRDALEAAGFVALDVSNATNRDALELNEMGRRYGFDVRLRYVREDVVEVAAIDKPNTIQRRSENHAERRNRGR